MTSYPKILHTLCCENNPDWKGERECKFANSRFLVIMLTNRILSYMMKLQEIAISGDNAQTKHFIADMSVTQNII